MRAPPGGTIRAIAAGTDSGRHGACLFALDENGILSFTAQEQPGGYWQIWQGPSFGGQPVPGAQIAVAGQNTGNLMLAMLDEKGNVWTMAQAEPSGGWGDWQGKFGYQERPFIAIAAAQLSGPRGIILMAADEEGQVWLCYQMNPGADWSGWSTGIANASGGQPFAADTLALAGQNTDMLILFAEADGRIAALPEVPPGGPWSALGLADQKPDLHGICACQQGGKGGAQLWGLDAGGQVWTLAQAGPGGAWGAWAGPGFPDQPEPFALIAAAGQNDGCTAFIGVGEKGDFWACGQTAPGGADWGVWKHLSAPPPT
jgi:hypothetical protein